MGGVSWEMVMDSCMKLRRKDSNNGTDACRGKKEKEGVITLSDLAFSESCLYIVDVSSMY